MSLADYYSRQGTVLDIQPLQPLWKPQADKRKRVAGGKLKLGDDEFMEWFNYTRPNLERWCQPTFEDSWANLFWYTGEYLPTMPLIMRTDSGQQVRIPRQLAPLAVNYINYLTNKRVAELSIYKANHETQPLDEDSNTDRMTSRVLKKLIEKSKRNNMIDDLSNDLEKENMIHGFVYASIDWDQSLGAKKSKNSNEKEGQTKVQLRHCWHVLPWRGRSWNLIPLIIEIEEILHVEEARVKYKDNSLQPFDSRNLYSFESPFIEKIAADECVIYRTIYKPDMFLPDGAVIRSTHEKVLSMEVNTYPWSHGEFPVERYTDIDISSRFFPMSFYQNVKPLQHTYNNLSGLLKRYIFTLGHPKIIHERGSVNIKALGNSPSLIGVKPNARMAPSIMQIKSIGSDPFNFRAGLKDEMVLFSDSQKVGLGELPPNTRSALMISRLREIENQQRGPQIDKRNSFLAKVLLKMGSVDADHVPLTSKANMARIVGKEMVPDLMDLKNVKVSDQTRVLIVNSTGFSAELTGRIAEIGAIENDAKLPLTPMEKRDIIGGVLNEKHYDVISAAKFTCQAEIEILNDGGTPTPPRLTDDLITYWTTMVIEMQTISHKRLPESIQKKKEARLLQIEALIEEVITKNPTSLFAQKAAMLDGYPRLYNMTPVPQGTSAASTPPPTSQPALDNVAAQNGGPPLPGSAPPPANNEPVTPQGG